MSIHGCQISDLSGHLSIHTNCLWSHGDEGNEVLTKNSDVKVLRISNYLWVDHGTIRGIGEVNSNVAEFTAVRKSPLCKGE